MSNKNTSEETHATVSVLTTGEIKINTVHNLLELYDIDGSGGRVGITKEDAIDLANKILTLVKELK